LYVFAFVNKTKLKRGNMFWVPNASAATAATSATSAGYIPPKTPSESGSDKVSHKNSLPD